VEALMAAAPPSDQLGALKWFAPPLLHVYPAPAQSFPDLKTTQYDTYCTTTALPFARVMDHKVFF